MPVLRLPTNDGRLESFTTRQARIWELPGGKFDRAALSAVHVVSNPMADNDPWLSPAVDWDSTIAYRKYI